MSSSATFFGLMNSLGKGFVPSQISDLQLWLDASDSSTITESGGNVSQWDDKSGNGNHATQGSAALQPETGARTINGLNALDFDGGDQIQTPDFNAQDPTNSIFVVAKNDTASPTTGTLISGRNAFTQRLNINASSEYEMFAFTNQSGGTVDTNTHLWNGNFTDDATGTLIIDGTTVVTGDAGPLGLTAVRVGQTESGTNGWNGAICEILFYSRVLSVTEREQAASYLSNKWGL